MVDTLTPVYGFVKQTVGGNRNTWGGILNANFDLLEDALSGEEILSATGGSLTLTQAQYRKRYITVTGTLVSDQTIIVPNVRKDWMFVNATAGGFGVLVKTTTSGTCVVPQGTTRIIFCNGANAVYRNDQNEVGQMAFFAGSTVPAGWVECGGQSVLRQGAGSDLFAKIGTTWGSVDGTTFSLPDAYTAGRFLRARTASIAIGTAQADAFKSHQHGGATNVTVTPTNLPTSTATTDGLHSHNGATGPTDVNHTHHLTINTGFQSADHVHSYTAPSNPIAFAQTVPGGANMVQGGQGANTGGTSGNHFHLVDGDTGGVAGGLSHTHPIGTAGSAHGHAISWASTTWPSSVTIALEGGTETRPLNLSAMLCIRL